MPHQMAQVQDKLWALANLGADIRLLPRSMAKLECRHHAGVAALICTSTREAGRGIHGPALSQ